MTESKLPDAPSSEKQQIVRCERGDECVYPNCGCYWVMVPFARSERGEHPLQKTYTDGSKLFSDEEISAMTASPAATPRTDEAENDSMCWVTSEFARELEREIQAHQEREEALLAAATEMRLKFERESAALRAEVEALRSDVERLYVSLNGEANARVAAESALSAARASEQSKQAKIDALMLEFCPEDMSHAQVAEWCRSQRPMTKEESAALKESK